MRVEPRKSNKKIAIPILIITLLVIGGVCLYLYATNPFGSIDDTSSSKSTGVDASSKNTSAESTSQSSQSTTKEPTKVENKTPIQYEGEQVDDGPTTDNEQFRIPEDQ